MACDWDIADYVGSKIDTWPVAIPSLGREDLLVEQTLSTLLEYGVPAGRIHVFLHPTKKRQDGSSEFEAYSRHLRRHKFYRVHLHAGGSTLMLQYRAIFKFFHGFSKVVVMSDTVPGFVWRKHLNHTTVAPLPKDLFSALVALAFDMTAMERLHCWSLGPCKCPRNMSPGRVCRRVGLLDGNCFGINLSEKAAPLLRVSNYTTDVEFSCRVWKRDGGFLRYLGVSALHKYRQQGGHKNIGVRATLRARKTADAICKLSRQFPDLIAFEGYGSCTHANMPYRFLRVGRDHSLIKGMYTNRGRRTESKQSARSPKQRMHKHRLG